MVCPAYKHLLVYDFVKADYFEINIFFIFHFHLYFYSEWHYTGGACLSFWSLWLCMSSFCRRSCHPVTRTRTGVWTSTSSPNTWKSTRWSFGWLSRVWTGTTMVGDEWSNSARTCRNSNECSPCIHNFVCISVVLYFCDRAHRCLRDPAVACRARHTSQQGARPENLTEV